MECRRFWMRFQWFRMLSAAGRTSPATSGRMQDMTENCIVCSKWSERDRWALREMIDSLPLQEIEQVLECADLRAAIFGPRGGVEAICISGNEDIGPTRSTEFWPRPMQCSVLYDVTRSPRTVVNCYPSADLTADRPCLHLGDPGRRSASVLPRTTPSRHPPHRSS
jgi:hypothetical protein